jgi:hypothetical protein
VGFALWTADGLAWAQGTHEYKPMGVAVISATDLFRQRDFDPARQVPAGEAAYVGLFASMVDLNDWLSRRERLPVSRRQRSDGRLPRSVTR